MFVDDEINILRMIQRLLRNEHWEMQFVRSGEEAWEALQEQPVDIIVTDHRMEGMTGTQLLARVKAAFPDTLRIIFSGYTEVSTLTEAINQGNIYKFIHKPIKEEDLRLTIRRAVENVLLMRENRKLTEKIRAQNEELRQLNEELELRIEQRTRDLYLRQKALETAQMVLDSLPTAVIGLDIEGTIVYCNSAYSSYFHKQQGEILGQMYEDVLPEPLQMLIVKTLEKKEPNHWKGMISGQTICAQTALFYPTKQTTGLILSCFFFKPKTRFDVSEKFISK
ncbi:MAG: response regulator [candidate division KSB1 bacterium]|nr:response regulator [candidate division KSB1 bacterium]